MSIPDRRRVAGRGWKTVHGWRDRAAVDIAARRSWPLPERSSSQTSQQVPTRATRSTYRWIAPNTD